MLDDVNVLKQRDPEGSLQAAAKQFEQTLFRAEVVNSEHDDRVITKIIIAGMGGSALAALLIRVWLRHELTLPLEVVRGYDLPAYVDESTLVIASSISGNTEETLSSLSQARERGAQVAVTASGGQLIDIAKSEDIAYVLLPKVLQPRMGVIYNLKSILALIANFGIIPWTKLNEVAATASWLESETHGWVETISTDKNLAKQIALMTVGKTPVFYGGALTAPVAYKWKISWNENAKNVAFWNEYPETNHNEFLGWTSHPVEKPFAVFDLVSDLEHPQILKRFKVSDKLLSGKRPAAQTIDLAGDSLLEQMLWANLLADFASIYTGILNGVDPAPVALIEKLKKELAD